MAGQKISEMLTATEIDGTEFVPIVKEGVNRKMTVQNLKGKDGVSPIVEDTVLLDIYNWTGSQVVANNTFSNFLSLAGISKDAGGTAGTSVTNAVMKIPPRVKPSLLALTVRISGTVDGGANTDREWRVQLRRTDDSIVASDAHFKLEGNTLDNRDTSMNSYTLNATDVFTTQGFLLGLMNVAGQTITLTKVSIRICRVVNQEG